MDRDHILVLGAGLVIRPFLNYLFTETDLQIRVASLEVGGATRDLVAEHPRGELLELDVNNTEKLRDQILCPEIKLVASFVPPVYHSLVARLCIEAGKSMIMTSYAKQELYAMQDQAREAGVCILAEIGFDPGIDHMSAMNSIRAIQEQGGEVVSFCSDCGALPAPEAAINPFGYKFSWHPRGALGAAKRPARFLHDKKEVEVGQDRVFEHYQLKCIESLGWLESYPNMDALPYLDNYNIPTASSIYRGTLRYTGWGETMKKFIELGLLNEIGEPGPEDGTCREFTGRLIGSFGGDELEGNLARYLGIDKDSAVIKRMQWLGLLDRRPVPAGCHSAFDLVLGLMHEKMGYNQGERDMVVLRDEIVASFPGRDELLQKTMTLIDYGHPGGDSAIARTVGLPSAIAAKLMLEGRFDLSGVHLPVRPEIYEPVLAELPRQGVHVREQEKMIASN
ncbi:MAG: saccharopine dehydrogenase NADP-binding domain-containing protein [Desulfohalobiaceae bacterium]|nr:saccharopine dehydrogenase NADP-binding domain-containing protein [Desulfohalobiaceae bacterium]